MMVEEKEEDQKNQGTSNRKGDPQGNIEFMPPIMAAHYRRPSPKANLLLWMIVGFFVSFIVYAAFAEIEEVTRGDGRVIPSSRTQMINHLEGGILREIRIQEGDKVEKNQVLLKIDPTVAAARFEEGKNLYYRHLAQVERLKAQINETPYAVPQMVQEKAPEIAAEEMNRYLARTQKLQNESSIAEKEVDLKAQELKEVELRLKELIHRDRLMTDEVKKLRPLVAKGLYAELEFSRLQREASEIRERLASTEVQMGRARSALQQAQEMLENIRVIFRNEDLSELRDASNKLATAQGSFTAEEYRFARTDVRSPVRGIVKQILKRTIGSVVQPGEDLIEIVPLEDQLVIEAKIKPSDIAYLHPGLKGIVKITAYDFTIYGGLEAVLTFISPDAIEEKDVARSETFYKVYLKTLGNKLSKSGEEILILPGMVVSVDIMHPHKKTILHYLLKPILRAKEHALTEH